MRKVDRCFGPAHRASASRAAASLRPGSWALALLALSGCQLVADFDRSKIPGGRILDAGQDAALQSDAAVDAALTDAASDATVLVPDASVPPMDAATDAGQDAGQDAMTGDDAGEDDAG